MPVCVSEDDDDFNGRELLQCRSLSRLQNVATAVAVAVAVVVSHHRRQATPDPASWPDAEGVALGVGQAARGAG